MKIQKKSKILKNFNPDLSKFLDMENNPSHDQQIYLEFCTLKQLKKNSKKYGIFVVNFGFKILASANIPFSSFGVEYWFDIRNFKLLKQELVGELSQKFFRNGPLFQDLEYDLEHSSYLDSMTVANSTRKEELSF
jgi:hypothetical protein